MQPSTIAPPAAVLLSNYLPLENISISLIRGGLGVSSLSTELHTWCSYGQFTYEYSITT